MYRSASSTSYFSVDNVLGFLVSALLVVSFLMTLVFTILYAAMRKKRVSNVFAAIGLAAGSFPIVAFVIAAVNALVAMVSRIYIPEPTLTYNYNLPFYVSSPNMISDGSDTVKVITSLPVNENSASMAESQNTWTEYNNKVAESQNTASTALLIIAAIVGLAVLTLFIVSAVRYAKSRSGNDIPNRSYLSRNVPFVLYTVSLFLALVCSICFIVINIIVPEFELKFPVAALPVAIFVNAVYAALPTILIISDRKRIAASAREMNAGPADTGDAGFAALGAAPVEAEVAAVGAAPDALGENAAENP